MKTKTTLDELGIYEFDVKINQKRPLRASVSFTVSAILKVKNIQVVNVMGDFDIQWPDGCKPVRGSDIEMAMIEAFQNSIDEHDYSEPCEDSDNDE